MLEKLKKIDGKRVNVEFIYGLETLLELKESLVEIKGTNLFFGKSFVSLTDAVDCSTTVGDLTFIASDLLIRVDANNI